MSEIVGSNPEVPETGEKQALESSGTLEDQSQMKLEDEFLDLEVEMKKHIFKKIPIDNPADSSLSQNIFNLKVFQDRSNGIKGPEEEQSAPCNRHSIRVGVKQDEEGAGGIIFYRIEINANDKPTTLKKRYRDLVDLHDSLKEYYDFHICEPNTIEQEEKSYKGYHVIPHLQKYATGRVLLCRSCFK